MKILPIWLVVGALALEALAAPFAIDKFTGDEAGDPDTYIAADFSNQLRIAKIDQIQDGRFYVRQKFEDPFGEEETTYQLFEGRATPLKAKLAKFSFDEVPYTTLIKAKFFLNRNAHGDEDIEKVYFDGSSIFVEGESAIYAHLNGKMQELSPSIEREYPVSITTQPAGVEVTVGESRKGVTPLDFTVNSTKPTLVTLKKEGFYTSFKVIKATPGKKLQEGVAMVAKKSMEDPVNPLRAQFLEHKNKKNMNGLKSLKTTVQEKIGGFTYESSSAIDRVLSQYPPLVPKKGNESPDDFNARKEAWEADRDNEKQLLENQSQNYLAALEVLLADIEKILSEGGFSLKYFYIPNSSLMLGTIGVKDAQIEINHQDPALSFEYSKAKVGFNGVPKSELVANREMIHAVAKMWDAPNENGKYATFHDIAFFYDEKPLTLLSKGTFSSPDATSASDETRDELEAKLKKLPNRSAWDSKDETATLEALANPSSSESDTEAVAQTEEEPEDEPEEEATYSSDDEDAQMASTARSIEEDDYATDDAEYDVTNRFGNSDEYIRWAAWSLAGVALATGVVGVLESQKYNDAKSDYDDTKSKISSIKTAIQNKCQEKSSSFDYDECTRAAIAYASTPGSALDNDRPLYILNGYLSDNKKTMDSYNQSRILWLSISAVSIAGSVVLFTW